MKSFGVMWFIILLDKSTVIKDGLIGSLLKETNFLFEFTVPIFRFYVFENLSKLCSTPWLFPGTKRNSFRVGVSWFRTSWWFPFYMFQLAPKWSFESASRQSWALEITKKRGIALADCERKNWFDQPAFNCFFTIFMQFSFKKRESITKISSKNGEKTFLKNIC